MGCPRHSDSAVAGLLNALEAGKILGLHGAYFHSFVDAFSSVARVCSVHPIHGLLCEGLPADPFIHGKNFTILHFAYLMEGGSWLHCRSVYWLDTWEGFSIWVV